MDSLCATYLARTEKFGRKAHPAALHGTLSFAYISVERWIVINYIITGLAARCMGSPELITQGYTNLLSNSMLFV